MLPVASPAASNTSFELMDTMYETQFLIPTGHSATLLGLLSNPTFRSVLEDFPKSYFHDVEEAAGLPDLLNLVQSDPIYWPSFDDKGYLRRLANVYFNNVSAHLPLLDRHSYEELQNKFFDGGTGTYPHDIEVAICLCVWALGCVASSASKPAIPEHMLDPNRDLGMHFFAIALRIIVSKTVWALEPSLRTCQALVLAASYFMYLGRPLYSWRMTYFASQMLLGIFNLYVLSLPHPPVDPCYQYQY